MFNTNEAQPHRQRALTAAAPGLDLLAGHAAARAAQAARQLLGFRRKFLRLHHVAHMPVQRPAERPQRLTCDKMVRIRGED